MMEFNNQIVLVTGGSSGIGLEIAKAFSNQCATAIICARNLEKLREVQSIYPSLNIIQADITNAADRENLIDETIKKYGRLDILVNNAGRLVERNFIDQNFDEHELVDEFNLNFISPILLTKLALLKAKKLSTIVFVTSGYALVSPKRAPTYGAAKAGLHGFIEGLRWQLKEVGTNIVEVLPPVVDTPATAHRKVAKISPETVAMATLQAIRDKKDIALMGQAKFLPFALRLFPNWIKNKVSHT